MAHRSRVSFFMNRFRRLGFIEYNGEIRVHNTLLNFFLQGKDAAVSRTPPHTSEQFCSDEFMCEY